MPTYVYRCRKCGHTFELFHGMTDETPRRCPKCRSKAERVPAGGAGLLFKGSGFYITDYRSSSYKDAAKKDTPGGGGSGGDGGAKKSSDGGKKSEGGSKKSSGTSGSGGAG